MNFHHVALDVPALNHIVGEPVWPQHAVQYQALSPAKLNLFLHVTGRKPDGYHLLQSLFCPLAWGDTLTLTVHSESHATPSGVQGASGALLSQNCPGWVLSRSGGLMHIPAERDLSWRAALAFARALPEPPQAVHVHLNVCKRIPEQAGLGGGSSNAATVLMLLNRALGQPLGLEALVGLALPLGADVPFFLYNSPAWVEGIGERICPMVLPRAWVLLYKPVMVCPTGTVFTHPALVRNSPNLPCPVASKSLRSVCQWLQQHTCNALQAVVAEAVPGWQAQFIAFSGLCAGHRALLMRMSGSGSAMFAVFEEEADCQKALLAGQALNLPGQWVVCPWA
jgi:4-diphosphocytidyl-2-C-methyl-D-erythritol kinase